MYHNLEDLVVKVCKGELYNSELNYICDYYNGDLSQAELQAMRSLFIMFFTSLVAYPQQRKLHLHLYGPP